MKKILIAGSSGMIGNLLLSLCLNSDKVKEIVLINRKPSGLKNGKIREYVHQDFLNLETIQSAFVGIDCCFYCVGVYTGQVSTSEFNKITIDYTKTFMSMLRSESSKATVCFLSGAGADASEKSKVLFAKAKGIAENFILGLKFPQIYIARPGYIYPVEKRQEPNAMYRFMRLLYKPVSFMYPNIGLSSHQLAQKLFELGMQGSNQIIYENKDLRK